eukprot:scaffold126185_cov42-Cyclotella_meneghiniana.AAC.3
MALSNGSASSLMANSHSSKPFSDQIMATMASSRPRSAPMIRNCSTASMKNDNESSNLKSISALLNECASSRRSTDIILQMTEAESAAAATESFALSGLNYSVASLENKHETSNLNNLMALSNGSDSSLMANSHSSKPFSDQIMATMASSRPRSAPTVLNCFTASMKNDIESSNLKSISTLLNECASSRRSTEIILQMTEIESAVAAVVGKSVQSASVSEPPLELAITTRDVSVNTWLVLNTNIGIGNDQYVEEHDLVPALEAAAAEVKPCVKLNHTGESKNDSKLSADSYFCKEC